MTETALSETLALMGIHFPIPPSQAFRQDFTERQMFVLTLSALNAIVNGIGVQALGQPREALSDGSGWVQLEATKCAAVVFSNSSDAAFLIRRGAGTVYLTLPPQSGKLMDVQEFASELYVRRAVAGDPALLTYELNGESLAP